MRIISKTVFLLAIIVLPAYGQGIMNVSVVNELGLGDQKTLVSPTDAAIDEEGAVYVADNGNKRVAVFGPNGQLRAEFGNNPKAEGALTDPVGIAVHKGKVFVTDTKANLVQVYDVYGKYLFSFGGKGKEDGNLTSPFGIVVTDNERVYVTEKDIGRISIFTTQGVYLGSLGSEIAFPTYLAIDRAGKFYVSDTQRLAIVILDKTGQHVKTLSQQNTGVPSPTGVLVSEHGWIIAADSSAGRILRITPEGAVDGSFGSQGKSRGQFKSIGGMQLGPAGQIVVTDTGNNKVVVLSTEWPKTQEAMPMPERIQRIGVDTAIPLTGSVDVAAGNNDLIYVLFEKEAGVEIYNREGQKKGVFAPLPDKKASRAQGARIAIGGNRIYISDSGSNCILVYDIEGNYKFTIALGGKDKGKLKDPKGIAVSDNKIFIADSKNNRVAIFSTDGVYLSEINDPQNLMKYPIDVAVDPSGRILVADAGNNRIMRFNPDGKLDKIIAGPQPDYFSGLVGVRVYDENRIIVLLGGKKDKILVLNSDGDTIMRFSSRGSSPGSLMDAAGMDCRDSSVYVMDAGNNRLTLFKLMDVPKKPSELKVFTDIGFSVLSWAPNKEKYLKKYRIYSRDESGKPIVVGDTAEAIYKAPYPLPGGQDIFTVTAVSRDDIESYPSDEVIDYGRRGIANAKSKDYEKALRQLQKAIELESCKLACTYNLAYALLEMKKYDEAEVEFQKLVQVKEWSFESRLILGKIVFGKGDMIKAEEELKGAVLIDPKSIEARMYLAETLYARKKWMEVNEHAQYAINNEPLMMRAHEILGLAYYQQKLYGKAEKSLMTASSIEPNNPVLYQEIAEVYLAQGDTEAAKLQFKKALSVDPNYMHARIDLGNLAIVFNNLDEAEEHARKIIEIDPNLSQGHLLKGKILSAKGDKEGAALEFNKAMELDANDPEAPANLANAYIELNQLGAANDILDKAKQRFPRNRDLFILTATVREKQLDIPGAIEALSEADKIDPDFFDARVRKANLHINQKEYMAAALEFAEASRLKPEDMNVRIKRAEALKAAGKNTEAEEALVDAANINPNNGRVHFMLGSLWVASEDYDRAIPELKMATYLAPDNAEYHYALGKAYIQSGEVDAAFDSLRRALELAPTNDSIKRDLDTVTQMRANYRKSENVPPVEIAEVTIQPAFAAIYKTYDVLPIGKAVIRNNSRETVYKIKVTFQVAGSQSANYQITPTTVIVDQLGPMKRSEVLLKVSFNEQVIQLANDTPLMGEIILEYNRANSVQKVSKTVPFTLYSRNAIIWSNKDMVGSFVTQTDFPVEDFARGSIEASGDGSDAIPEALHKAVVIFESLGAYGMRYLEDPNRPFRVASGEIERIDTVQFPRDSLKRKLGDCDDLSMLYASLLENLGVETALALVPGHILVLVNSGVSREDSYMVSEDESSLIVRNGKVWIPVEVTMIGAGFSEAWAKGAAICNQANAAKNLDVIEVHQAWKKYDPAGLQMDGWKPDVPASGDIDKRVSSQENIIVTQKIEKASAELLSAIKADPDNTAPRLQLGILYARNGKYDEAVAQFEEALSIDPKNYDAINNIGNIHFLKGEYQAALEKFIEAEMLAAADAEIKINLAMTYYRLGDIAKARVKFDEAVKIDPDMATENEALKELIYK